jgi:hypothetical protein
VKIPGIDEQRDRSVDQQTSGVAAARAVLVYSKGWISL